MSVLVVFETVEGQTHKIAGFVRDQALNAGLSAVMFNTADETKAVSFDGIEKVILAAPVHERRHPRAFENFVATNLNELTARDTLLISISLKAAFPDGLEEAKDFLIEMEMRTGFTPDAEALVAGAVRTKSYDYFTTMIVQHVVLKGQDYNLEGGEREFTDWEALATTVTVFLDNGFSPENTSSGK